MSPLRILYRGPLASCNYDCGYCPFGKVTIRQDELDADFQALGRFVGRITEMRRPISVFFTPWGEALIHEAYQRAIAELTQLDHVVRVAAQTNLSWSTRWLESVDPEILALWVTWHPQYMPLPTLLDRCRQLSAAGVRHSVGIVGQREHFDAIAAARRSLPADTYLWVNANKRIVPGYSAAELDFLEAIDPLFSKNLRPYSSAGLPCGAGETSVTVDGDGVVRRCHFIDAPIGHVSELDAALAPRDCSNAECRCHIGYVNLPASGVGDLFGDGLLERIPAPTWPGWGAWRVLE